MTSPVVRSSFRRQRQPSAETRQCPNPTSTSTFGPLGSLTLCAGYSALSGRLLPPELRTAVSVAVFLLSRGTSAGVGVERPGRSAFSAGRPAEGCREVVIPPRIQDARAAVPVRVSPNAYTCAPCPFLVPMSSAGALCPRRGLDAPVLGSPRALRPQRAEGGFNYRRSRWLARYC